ncbi:hypothetical protein FHS61_002685 [Altererythrobacter atlanticus]|uniref:DUF8021 domain-containing protein n=1 Tax=Croceibacterium atlanticum TaxID=1267766 RepID=A0A0F7KUA6_9SPHN|nr:hypothetical protein [Croceibacterium atlanticum]AKH43908.1 hypothetical protein WYH_02881 [Croceibacterium atlanticum]MBB5733642.1 hypothetical protein [Croceibacterium atlanticum]
MATREELYAVLDRFIAALERRDPAGVEWADDFLNSENNVVLQPGDGLWNTITARGDYDLRFADERTGQVALFTCVEETDALSPAAFRLGIKDGRIAEAETVIARNADEGFPFKGQKFELKPVMEAMVPAGETSPREELLEIANGYFETIERNDGTINTKFHPHCNRVENGVQTTNNQDFPLPIARLGCEEQFALGWYRYDDRLRARRFPLVDEERGIVLAHGFIDHCGIVGDYELADGTPASSPVRRPHSYYLAEAFKIRAGAIEQVEAVFHTVPYHMPSPWDSRS